MNWILIIYILGIIAALLMWYNISEDRVKIGEIAFGILLSLLSWITFLFLFLIRFEDTEIQKKNKSNKFKVR